jgi:hypothetical protein
MWKIDFYQLAGRPVAADFQASGTPKSELDCWFLFSSMDVL